MSSWFAHIVVTLITHPEIATSLMAVVVLLAGLASLAPRR